MTLDLHFFTGGPRVAVMEAVLDAGHRVERVYANDPERWPKVLPCIELARRRDIPVAIVKRRHELAEIEGEIAGRLCLSAGFNYLFPSSFLESAAACLNVHGSLLPKYKGARTLAWAIEQGERESGVTVHLVDPGMDTGPILLQRSFPLSPFETTKSLARKTGAFEPEVVVEALDIFERKGVAACRAQAPIDDIDWPNRSPDHSEVDPKRPLLDLFNKIRAADPVDYPAHFYVEGQKVCIRLWRPDKPESENDLV